jgi:hypothetical protein
MTDIAFVQFAFTATGGTTNRTLPDRLAEIVNVKDFGAYGDGMHDDAAAIQSAINYAFGSPGSYHGSGSDVTAGIYANRQLFFPNGTYNVSVPLLLTQVQGVRIFGAGKRATRIINTATSGPLLYGCVFRTNGFAYSTVEHMTLVAAPPGSSYAFDLEWNNNVSGTRVAALNEILFRNVRFESGDVGCAMGVTTTGNPNPMGSEITLISCDFVNCGVGAQGVNYNSLDFTYLGCSWSGCGIGVSDHLTSPPSYFGGCNFSGSTSYDIYFGGSFDGIMIEACTSSSAQFLELLSGAPVKTKSCTYNPSSGGLYAIDQNLLIMDGCIVTSGTVNSPQGTPGKIYLRGNSLPASFVSGSNPPTILENI